MAFIMQIDRVWYTITKPKGHNANLTYLKEGYIRKKTLCFIIVKRSILAVNQHGPKGQALTTNE